MSRFRIRQYIKLRSRSYISIGVGTTHKNNFLNLIHNFRFHTKSHTQIGHRAGSNHSDFFRRIHQSLNDVVNGMIRLNFPI